MCARKALPIRYSPNQFNKTPESFVLKACLDWLAAEHIWAVRMNTGALLLNNANGQKRSVSFGVKGMADILAMPCLDLCSLGRFAPVPLWVECKAEQGKLSEHQVSFQEWVTRNGHFYIVARDPEDIHSWIEQQRRIA